MNVFARTLAVVALAIAPSFAQAETPSSSPDNAAIMAAIDRISHRLDALEAAARSERPRVSVNDPDLNSAMSALTFDEHNPMGNCRDVECYGAGALRRAYELGRVPSVVMNSASSCARLNRRGDQIPCKVDEDAAGTHVALVGGEMVKTYDCHSLKCFGFLAIDDLTTRNVIKRISLPSMEACRTLDEMVGHFTSCRGDDDTSPIIKPLDADDD